MIKRQKFIEKKTNSTLRHSKHCSFNVSSVVGQNCENVLGTTQVPLGVAGPIIVRIYNKKLKLKERRECFIPLSTTEGALVASVNRGCKAMNLSGVVNVYVEDVGATRGPYLIVKNLKQGQEVITWIENNWGKLQGIAVKTSPHVNLTNWTSQLVGKTLYLKFQFNTGEAMGMNMVTIATEALMKVICNYFDINRWIVSGNYCIDKKPAWENWVFGRGKKVWAEAVIKHSVVKNILKTTPGEIAQVVKLKQLQGSAITGSMGFNAHVANIIAAFYLATGQDLGHIVEGSLGITAAELEGNNLHFSIFLPAVMVGTIGGGTGLPTQKEALEILGLNKLKAGDAIRLAGIVAAAVLAGELSLTASLAARDLGKAHQNLGRKKD